MFYQIKTHTKWGLTLDVKPHSADIFRIYDPKTLEKYYDGLYNMRFIPQKPAYYALYCMLCVLLCIFSLAWMISRVYPVVSAQLSQSLYLKDESYHHELVSVGLVEEFH